jgi:SAM-dependent methyltransferase
LHSPDPTRRFSDRVENYAKYRPGYPPAVYDLLREHAGLQPGAIVADLGSGTGLLSSLFTERGHKVYAVEPNAQMRAAAESFFDDQSSFISIPARAEATTLPASRVDFIVAGQAFHWFEPTATRAECLRILQPGGQVALIWNRRHTESSAFQRDYELLLEEYGTDFKQVDQQRTITDEMLAAFFAPASMHLHTLPNSQRFDAAGLRGRLLSSSYTPPPADPRYEPMLAALEALFTRYQQSGFVSFAYITAVYHGHLS